MMQVDLFGEPVAPVRHASILGRTWDYPPFSVLNARDGWWQDRKREWLALGIESELGRADDSTWTGRAAQFDGYRVKEGTRSHTDESGTSIFDPVLCELAFRWFCRPGGRILDPFAGGSVRGIVASVLGYQYEGCELRAEQVAANRKQMHLARAPLPVWANDDSRNIARHFEPGADFLFSCPPYADLEVYSDDPRDLSAMPYEDFRRAYGDIIAASVDLLAKDRFACFVVGDVRDKRGNYRNFVGDTVEAFRAAGAHFYNEAVLVTAVGSLSMRAGKQFTAGRKLGKTHQNVLVFVKGDGKRAAQACGAAE